ncbi:unnamed protein product [Pelagomonas calceolata]|uniref:Glycosyltransferase 61 catalytic domain-containing protein n=1 Tax=Pelagomonas calceolata TaxID=35677 RepID=A0A8J2SNR4_9STRA|nr:unnamed protein product [Pelagomonas calceolata]
MMMGLPSHLVLIAVAVAAPETTVHEQIRSALATGEAALQASRWRASSDAYERALHLMKHHKLQINVAAESQLTNNVAWAAFKLGDHERALRHYEASARSCDSALREGFNECLNKVYDNLHELVHRTLRRRGLAIDYLREGLASAKRAIDERGLDEAALLNLDGNVRVRLGYLLVLHGELNEAESTLGPLLRHALTNTTGSSEHGLFTGPNVEKRALLQEAATYVGWSRAFRRDWTGASDAHAVGAALALPRDASGCTLPRWRVQDGWLTPERSWTVHPLAVKAPILRFGNVVAPICAVRRRFGAKDRPGAGPGWCGASEPSLSPGLARLVEIPNAFLGGKDGSALWQRAPHCVFFAGEVTSSGAPPPDWGDAAANSGLTDKDVVLQSEPEDTITIESALLLFDAREGHKMFWHHQTESVSRLALALCRLFDRDGKAASDLPEQTRNMLSRAVILFPQALTATITALLQRGHATTKALERQRRLRAYDWSAGRVYSIRAAFVLDWPPAAFAGTADAPGGPPSGGAPRWEPRSRRNEENWIAELASKAAAPYGRRYKESLFRLHFVPPGILRTQAAFLRRAFPPDRDAKPTVLWYSRRDCDKRHVKSEDEVIDALRTRFKGRLDVVSWAGGATPDAKRAAAAWSRAALVVGPHGAGLANMVHCAPGTVVLVLPAGDAAGAPSASDEVFAHLAVALGLDLRFFRMAEPPLMFHNYSKFDQSAVRAVANEAWGALFPDEPPPPLSPYGDEDDDVEVVSEVVA